MKKYILPIIIILVLIAGCENAIKLHVLFDDIGMLNSSTLVYYNDEAIGKVSNVQKTDNNKYSVEIFVDREYDEWITDKTEFYLISKDEDPRIIMVSNKGNELEDNAVFEGKDELAYRIREAIKALQDMVGNIFGSEEWELLKESVDEFVEKGYEEGREHFPQINDNLKEFFNEFNEKYGKKLEMNIGPYIDSLIEDFNSITKDDK